MWRSWTNDWLTIIAAVLCAVSIAGCNSVRSSGIDPSGEHVFSSPPPPVANTAMSAAPNANLANQRYFDQPLNQLPWDDVAVLIEPRETVVPVGSEVIVIAGVAGPDGYLRTNRRLEWTIAAGSVGQFVDVEKGSMVDLMLGDFNWPRKIDATTAVGSTSRSNIRLNRGTCTPDDDKFVLRGQGWITLTSSVEGTSHVNVVAPEVYNWDARTKSAAIHWVDAVVQFPPLAINPAGTKHVFTTTVTRNTNQSPCENWLVRYEITDGPPAGFSPDGSTVAEVRTNSAGQGSVEIFQKQPASGTNKICIQVIRPADAPGSGGQRLVVGNGATTKTWSAADLAVHVSGPATANIGATIAYQIELSNPGDLVAKDAAAVLDVPDGLAYLSSTPQAEVVGKQLRWRLGELGARQRRPIEINFRTERQGSAVLCCDATAAGSLKVRDCATTTIATQSAPPPAAATPASPASPATPTTPNSPLDVRIASQRPTVTVGEMVTFEITITNRGTMPLNKLGIKVRLDPGMEHKSADAKNIIDRVLSSLSPGETQQFGVEVRAKQPGRLFQTVEVTAPGVAPATAQAFVQAIGNAAPPTINTPPTPAAIPLSVTMTGPPTSLTVGKLADFTIEVKNTGNTTLQNIRVVDRCDPALDRTKATDGWRFDNDALVWNIDSLLAGQSALFRIRCNCQAVAAKAYHRATVTLPNGGSIGSEAFVEIQKSADMFVSPPLQTNTKPTTPPADGGLLLSAVGLSNPVRLDKELIYEIRVTNNGTAPYQQLTVTANVPTGMTPVQLGTNATINGQTIRFNTEPELAPGKSLTFRVRVLAKQVGVYRFHAELTALGLPKPMSMDADETEIRSN